MDAEDLRLAVYRAFAETGRVPEPGELAGKLGTGAREVAAGLAELARGDLPLGDQGQWIPHDTSLWCSCALGTFL
jgi:hypothetical protein